MNIPIFTEYTEIQIREIAKDLASRYDPFMVEAEVWDLLYNVLPDTVCDYWRRNSQAHSIVNDILLHYYPGEQVIKYHFIKEHIGKQDEVTLLEMSVNASRLDIGRVNGQSYAYEVKTELDTLNRLERQIDDYLKAFEFVHVIADRKHVAKLRQLVPPVCGIIQYDLIKDQCAFKALRGPRKSGYLDKITQLNSLSTRDLEYLLKQSGQRNIGKTRAERQEQANILPNREINRLFKLTLKWKYSSRWSFVSRSFDSIYPIDIQVFFHTKVDPNWVYHRDSCMV